MFSDLYTVFQPIVNLQSNLVFGYEALLRGKYPTDEIIKYAISSNKMRELDLLSHDIAINEFHKQYTLADNIFLFLNCHPDSVLDKLYYMAKLDNVILEITEHKSKNIHDTINSIKNLKRKGLKIALDDFGSGQNTMTMLKSFRPDYIKIDKSIIQNLQIKENIGLCSEVLDICSSNSISTIAEGIETQYTMDFCKEIGIHYGQGYYIGRPNKLLECDINVLFANQINP